MLVLIFAALFIGVAVSVAPGGPLYAYGNVRASRFLTAFGFTSPIPEKFLQPVSILQRLFPGNNTDSDETLRQNAQGPGYLVEVEYMPDKTYVQICRMSNDRTSQNPAEVANRFLDGNNPVGNTLARTKTLQSQKKISGYMYDCAEADFAPEDHGNKKFHVLVAVRKLKSAHQMFSILAVTPGSESNMSAINELLDCMSVK